MRYIDILSTVTSVIAFAMHAVGTAFPYWWVVQEDEVTELRLVFYYGIWVIRECTNDTCNNVRSKMHGDRAWLIGPAVLVIIAGVLLVAAAVLCVVCLVRKSFSAVLRKLTVLLSSGAGGVIILAVLIFYKKKAGLHPSYAPETSEGDPGWALFLSTFGGIIGIINAFLIGCGIS